MTITYGPEALELTIVDSGNRDRGNGPRRAPGGHGLIGMRERTALFGGTLTAGPRRRPRLRGPRVAALRRADRMTRLRVVIADDQPMMRAGFKAVLEATGDIEVVAEAGTGAEAVAAASQHAPDVVLMDIRMPEMDGIEATRRLPRQRVLILTTFGLDDYIIAALRAGASGFLLKDAPTAEVVDAVRAVAAGDAVLSPAVTRQLLDQVGRRLPAAVSQRPEALAAAHRARARGPAHARRRAHERRDRATRSSSPRPRSRPTSPTCSASSACATASRP